MKESFFISQAAMDRLIQRQCEIDVNRLVQNLRVIHYDKTIEQEFDDVVKMISKRKEK